jgi:hypothetical protein
MYSAFYSLVHFLEHPMCGQILIEVHTGYGFPPSRGENPLVLLEVLEAHGFRIFHKEGNYLSGNECCTEWSLVRKDWSRWEKNKVSMTLK